MFIHLLGTFTVATESGFESGIIGNAVESTGVGFSDIFCLDSAGTEF